MGVLSASTGQLSFQREGVRFRASGDDLGRGCHAGRAHDRRLSGARALARSAGMGPLETGDDKGCCSHEAWRQLAAGELALTGRDLRVPGSPPRRGTVWHWCAAKYGRVRASRLRHPRLALVLLRRCVRLRAGRARGAPRLHALDSRRLHQFSLVTALHSQCFSASVLRLFGSHRLHRFSLVIARHSKNQCHDPCHGSTRREAQARRR
jgi:hypothetical protein